MPEVRSAPHSWRRKVAAPLLAAARRPELLWRAAPAPVKVPGRPFPAWSCERVRDMRAERPQQPRPLQQKRQRRREGRQWARPCQSVALSSQPPVML